MHGRVKYKPEFRPGLRRDGGHILLCNDWGVCRIKCLSQGPFKLSQFMEPGHIVVAGISLSQPGDITGQVTTEIPQAEEM